MFGSSRCLIDTNIMVTSVNNQNHFRIFISLKTRMNQNSSGTRSVSFRCSEMIRVSAAEPSRTGSLRPGLGGFCSPACGALLIALQRAEINWQTNTGGDGGSQLAAGGGTFLESKPRLRIWIWIPSDSVRGIRITERQTTETSWFQFCFLLCH